MMKFSKRDSRKMIKEMARLHGLSVSEVREQIQDKIIAVMNSDDPDQQAEFRRMFGNSYKSQDNLTNLLQLSVLNFFRIKFIFDSIRWTINIK